MKFLLFCVLLFFNFSSNDARVTSKDGHAVTEVLDHHDDHEAEKSHQPHWSYHGKYGPEHWGELEDNCAPTHHRQSPINIRRERSMYHEYLKDVELVDTSEDTPNTAHIVNNGHTVVVTTDKDYYLSGGSFHTMFKVAGFHFHWGSDSTRGSEHTIDGKAFPLEMHIVTYDAERFGTIGEAINGEDSLAVLGVLFKVSSKDNKNLEPVIQSLSNVTHPDPDKKADLEVNIADLLPSVTKNYYRYLGSLTTPGCFQSVVWTVFEKPQPISERQLQQFRLLTEGMDDHGEYAALVDNWRPAQPMFHRMVVRSFMYESEYNIVQHDATATHSTSPSTTATIRVLLASVLFAALAAWIR